MRALVCRAWGAVEDLVVDELPAPVPAADQVLIEVGATAVNYADAIMVGGTYQTKPPLPFAPGLETAGTVIGVGAKVTRFKPGDRVMALLAYGGLAEQAVAAEGDSWLIPDGMPFDDAAAFPVAYLSSDVALRWNGRLAAGETLLVLGASGGVGLTAVEIGKAMGARVIAAASTREKLEAARSRGADHLVNYNEQDLTEAVMKVTGDQGADVCFDPVGGEYFDKALSSLGWGGRIVLVGFVGGIPQIPANRLLVKNRSACGSSLRFFRWNQHDKITESCATLLRWYAEGKLKPMITREFLLDEAVSALKLLTGRQAMGRILVRP
ncbi:MAG: NADPH:quinone oxidoreductase family protein [Gammaproteobacteria bacterium]